ncbi:hypothetical protein ACRAKJ_15385 [Saccharothrix sp. DSM 118769]
MVTDLSPTTIVTPPPGPGGESGFTMEQSGMDALQQQADQLRTGYEEVSSKLSGQSLAGNAFGTAGAFAVEAFNASNGRSIELTGRAASALGLIGEGLRATAQTQQQADHAGGEQFAKLEPAQIAEKPQGAPADSPGGTAAPQGPPVTPVQDVPGGPAGSGGGGGVPTPEGPPVSPTGQVPGADGTTHASKSTGPEAQTAQGTLPTGQGGGAPTGQAATLPTGQMPPTPTPTIPNTPGAPTAAAPTKPSVPGNTPTTPGGSTAGEARTAATPAQTATSPTPAPVPAFPEIPDPPAVPTGNGGSNTGGGGGAALADALKPTPTTGGTTPSAGTTPPPTPPIPEVPKDLFTQPTIPDLATGNSGSGPLGGSATSPAGGMTPPPTPPIPEVPKELFTQPTIPDLGTGGGSASTGGGSGSTGGGSGPLGGSTTSPAGGMMPPPTPPIPEVPKDLFTQPTIPDLGSGSGSIGGGSAGSGGGGTSPAGGMTPPPTPPIPVVPKDLFTQPTIPDLGSGSGTGSGSTGGSDNPGPRPGEQSPGEQGGRGDRDQHDREHGGRDREGRDQDGRDREGREGREGRERGDGEHEDGSGSGAGGGGGAGGHEGRSERELHGFPVTSVDGEPCLDLRDLPTEEGERWQEKIRDILATRGEGSFFWAGDTIDAQGRRHSLMDLAEFMTNLDVRDEPGRPDREARDTSDTVAASPARSASGDVYLVVGPNRADGGPVALADFPTLQANPRVERVFAIDAVTGRETQVHPKVV